MHTIYKRLSASAPDIFGNGPIRKQHKLLYQVVRFVRLLKVDICRMPGFIELKSHFILLHSQCAFCHSLSPQQSR